MYIRVELIKLLSTTFQHSENIFPRNIFFLTGLKKQSISVISKQTEFSSTSGCFNIVQTSQNLRPRKSQTILIGIQQTYTKNKFLVN